MNLNLRIRSALINLVFSEGSLRKKRALAELRRKTMRQRHIVSVFLELDDPYSYLLCHYLPELAEHFDIDLRLYLTEAVGGPMRPAPDLYPEYVLNDCRLLAQELGIPFLDKGTQPVEHRLALIDALASTDGSTEFNAEVIEAITAYWRGDSEAVSRRADSRRGQGGGALLLEKNQRLLEKLGHYNPATMHYAGEWYWGVDRLHYLADRLTSLGANRGSGKPPGIASITQVMQLNLPVKPPAAAKNFPALELFYSFRSPYSYLALRRCMDIADAFGIEFKIRPVLPMIMRGMQVPKLKLFYIAADTARESRRLGIPFGRMADPIGKGVERCLAVLEYAIGEHRERDFLINAGEAIWSDAVDVATDKGLRQVATKTGLFWPDVLAALENEEWRGIADDNRQSMMESGSWGVPTMRLGDFVTWGQDRDWLLVRHIEELCDSGDGILV